MAFAQVECGGTGALGLDRSARTARRLVAACQTRRDGSAWARPLCWLLRLLSCGLCTAAGEKVQDFNSQGIANSLWAMGKTGTYMPEVFETLCTAAGEKVQDFDSQGIATALWAMAEADVHMPLR